MSTVHEMLAAIAYTLPRELQEWHDAGPYVGDSGESLNAERLDLTIGERVRRLAGSLDEFGRADLAAWLRSSADRLRVAVEDTPTLDGEHLAIAWNAFVDACHAAGMTLESSELDVEKIVAAGRKSVGGGTHQNAVEANAAKHEEARERAERAFRLHREALERGELDSLAKRAKFARDHHYGSAAAMRNAFSRYGLTKKSL